MTSQKTLPAAFSADVYLATLTPAQQQDCQRLISLLTDITQAEPALWAGRMVGFGQYHYRYASGHSGTAFLLGFAFSKTGLTLYCGCDLASEATLLAQLGKFKHGKGCLYLKKLADVDIDILRQLLCLGRADLLQRYANPEI